MDTGDRDMQGDFDLDLDLVNVSRAGEAPKPVTPEVLPPEKLDTAADPEAEVLFEQQSGDLRDVS